MSTEILTLEPEFGLEESIDFSTLITEMETGKERRRAKWTYGLRKYRLRLFAYDETAMDTVWDFYISRKGAYDSFLIKFPTEYIITGEAIATGNGLKTQFVLDEFPVDTSSANHTFYLDGSPTAVTVTNNFDTEYSYVEFSSAPGNGVVITGDYHFYFQARFLNDSLSRQLIAYQLLNMGVEVKEVTWDRYRPRAGNTLLLVVDVSDSISVTDEIEGVPGYQLSISDSISISESTDFFTSIYHSPIWDYISVDEYVHPHLEGVFGDVHSEIFVVDYINVRINTLFINVDDLIAVTDVTVDVTPTPLSVSVFDSITVAESTTTILPVLLTSISESISIAEFVSAFKTLYVDVSDSISIAESITNILPLLTLSISDDIAITDVEDALIIPLLIDVSDSISIAESDTEFIPVLFLPRVTEALAYAHWHLNESSGTNAPDTSGNSRDGTLTNMFDSDWVTGKLNNALDFDGINDYVDCQDIAGFDYNQEFSLEAWIDVDTLPSGGAILVFLGKTSGTNGPGYWLYVDASSRVNIEIVSSSPNRLHARTTAGVIPTENVWHHIIVTHDGTGTVAGIKIFVDGSDQALDNVNDTLSASITNAIDFQISGYNGTNSVWEGQTDEVVVYNYKVNQSFASARYNGGTGTEFRPGGDGIKVDEYVNLVIT